MTTEQHEMNKIKFQDGTEIPSHPLLNGNGVEQRSKDGTVTLVTEPMIIVPKRKSNFNDDVWGISEWDADGATRNINGWWSWNGTQSLMQRDVPVEAVLSLGGFKATGTRYENLMNVKAITGSQPNTNGSYVEKEISVPATAQDYQQQAGKRDSDRNESIREQAFFNNLDAELLHLLPPERQEAFLSAWFDTGMLMLRPMVRERAESKMGLKKADEIIEQGNAALEEEGWPKANPSAPDTTDPSGPSPAQGGQLDFGNN